MKLLIDFLVGTLVAASLWAVSVLPSPAQEPVIPYGQGSSAQDQPTAVQWHPVQLSSLSGTVTSVRGQAAKLAYIYCYNPNAAVAYLQIFDAATAASVTLGTTTPTLSLGIPATQASGLGPALIGLQFLNGIQVASTTTATGASGSSQNCNVAYN